MTEVVSKPRSLIAIYKAPAGSPGLIAMRTWACIAGGEPIPGEPTFYADMDAAHAQIPRGFQRRMPSQEDRKRVPLLLEIWVENIDEEDNSDVDS